MTRPETCLAELGIVLPDAVVAAANYAPGKLHGDLLYLSGQTPREGRGMAVAGKVGGDVSVDLARDAARICGTRLLAVARGILGTLDAVKEVLELTVYVNATQEFVEPGVVADAASELLVQVFGAAGRHARTAVCVNQLPQGAAVEISAVFAVTHLEGR